jgi:uncharacterized protein YjaZ
VFNITKWHWLYRGFVNAFDHVSDYDDWLEAFIDCYININYKTLFNIHFNPYGFDNKDAVYRRLSLLNVNYYSKLYENIKLSTNYEEKIISSTRSFLDKLEYNVDDHEVYVIVGLGCTNIYSRHNEGRNITVLCLESVNGELEGLQLLLAHECHHWARQAYFKEDLFTTSIGQRLVTEGLAACFSKYVKPGYDVYDYCFVPKDTVIWVEHHLKLLEEAVLVNAKDNALINCLFSRTPETMLCKSMPPRTGYVYGYKITEQYIMDNELHIKDTLKLPWEFVLHI